MARLPIPEICDYDCPQAGFPPPETAGICRTMSAVWCRQLGELVRKNVPCEWRRRQRAEKPAVTTGGSARPRKAAAQPRPKGRRRSR
jgi:hypothetical protein